jgi:probable HAF family extracellular repeat protein
MVGLSDLAGGAYSSVARACSADGLIVVGQATSASGTEAFRWTGAGMVGLGDDPGGTFNSYARAITPDGSIIVGFCTTAAGTEGFLYSHGIMRPLGGVPGAGVHTEAHAVSASGRVMVGLVQGAGGGGPPPLPGAGIWTQRDGWRTLPDYLNSLGLGPQISGWFLDDATGISDDGRTIVGTALSPGNITQGWVAVIPAYCPADWNADGQLTPADVAAYINAWFTSLTAGTLTGDFDLDNSVAPADVAAFVNAWFSALVAGC